MPIKILDLNLWLLPPPASKHNRKRINKFFKIVKKHNPDVITLQEIWLNKYVKIIKKNLPDYHCCIEKTKGYNKSGLLTLTKIKPISQSFIKFKENKNYSFIEKVGKKGFLNVKLNFKDHIFFVTNTHMYSPFHAKDTKFTLAQFEHIKHWSKSKDVVLSGDLNMTHQDFLDANSSQFILAKDDDYHDKGVNEFQEYGFNRFIKRRNDYVIVNTKKHVSVISKFIKGTLVSDHNPIIATVKFK